MAFFQDCLALSLLIVNLRQHVFEYVEDAAFVVHHLFERYEVGVDFVDATVHFSGNLQSVARPKQMVDFPKVVTLFGKVMLVRLLQPEKHWSPNDVTLFGKVMLVRLLQSLKNSFPRDVMPFGKVMLVRLLQPEKHPYPQSSILFGNVILVRPHLAKQ